MLDSETRLWLAQMVTAHKRNDDVTLMLAKAKKVVSKVPSNLISDGVSDFAHAHKKQYAAKNFLHRDSEHHGHIHMSGDTNNNQTESFNGSILRTGEKVVRGTKRDDSVILKGLQIHRNFIRPHPGLDGSAPAGSVASGSWVQVEDGHPECRQILQLPTLSTENGSR